MVTSLPVRAGGPSTSMDGLRCVVPNGALATTPCWGLPACDSSSSSTGTSLPLFPPRLPRSRHSEKWWQDPWALSGLSFPCHPRPLELGTQAPGKTRGGCGRLSSWPPDLSLCGRAGLALGKPLEAGTLRLPWCQSPSPSLPAEDPTLSPRFPPLPRVSS